MARRCCLLHLIKQNALLETFLRTLILMTPTPKLDKKIITNLDSSKASSPDCITVVVLKNCGPKLSYISTELFSIFV